MRLVIAAIMLLSGAQLWATVAQEPPAEWIDPDTGHRVIRLSREPGSASLYFHQNAYTADGKKLIITTPTGLATIDLQTRAIEKVVEGRVNVIVTGRKTGQVYYARNGIVYATDLNTKVTKEIGKLPPRGAVATLNADETLLAGAITEGNLAERQGSERRNTPTSSAAPESRGRDSYPGKSEMMERRLAAHLPMQLFTLNTSTGEVKVLLHSTDWLNHFQFSPTDPTLLMFCHEGPWHKVDRIWTIRTDGSGLRKIHTRTMDMEIAGHEFFGPDGNIIWYDLQTPKSRVFWLAGHELATGKLIKYSVAREHWSVHFNVSPDGKLFAGDGGGPRSVAAPGNGQWIYLFTPRGRELEVEKLVDLRNHDYRLEPNVTFTPDGKWVVFRSNMHGGSHVYAVEAAPAP